MIGSRTFDDLLERVSAGGHLSAGEVTELADVPDVVSIGMLADAVRRRLHGGRVTYLRVAVCPLDRSFADAVPPAAREVRITGAPETLAVAIAAVESAKAVAADRVVSGFAWSDVVRLAAAEGVSPGRTCADLRSAGLEALAEVPIDTLSAGAEVIETLRQGGFEQLRITVQQTAVRERLRCFLEAAALQDRIGGIQAINPLPTFLNPTRPTTGYEDVKGVALARLAAPNIPMIQVDWQRYGPKLAQVGLTFGADDLDTVTASDDAPDGHRRAPLEDLRRNIEAAGFEAVERDGRFRAVGEK